MKDEVVVMGREATVNETGLPEERIRRNCDYSGGCERDGLLGLE